MTDDKDELRRSDGVAKCKSCGRGMLWGITEDGNRMPLDPRPPVYIYDADTQKCVKLGKAEDGSGTYVSHFATCPTVKAHSASSPDKEKAMEWMRAVAKSSGKELAGSAAYVALMTEDFLTNPQCALELGLAILMNKPILVMAQEGVEVPPAFKKLADVVGFWKDKESLAKVTKESLEKVLGPENETEGV